MKIKYSLFIIICLVLTIAISGCIWSLDNPSDSHSDEFTVKSEAALSLQSINPIYQNTTISVWGGIKSKPVEEAGLVYQYRWDFGNDGTVDTILYNSATVNIPLKTTGNYSVSMQLYDSLGYVSSAYVNINVLPEQNIDTIPIDTLTPPDTIPIDTLTPPDTIPKDTISLTDTSDIISILDVILDSDCAFYTKSQHTMKPVVMMGRYFSYKNKTESLKLGNFIFELLKNLTGTIDYNTLSLPYMKGFSNGIYTLDNGSLAMKAVFLYGSTNLQHNENDTIRYNLFDPRSYIKSFDIKPIAPYFIYEKGPLWDLTSGFNVNTSNPLKPRISLNIDMRSIKFSGLREVDGRYTLSALINEPNQLSISYFDAIAFRYQGRAQIDPFFIRDIVSLVQNDSFKIDMSGSVIETDSFPIKFSISNGTKTIDKSFNFFIRQQMLNQKVRFGNGNNNLKVVGAYTAKSQLSVKDHSLVNSFFNGFYSTSATDTASFFCDENLQSKFGNLYFASPQPGYLTFISDRYSYQFSIKEGSVFP